jgi:hypothetical protein
MIETKSNKVVAFFVAEKSMVEYSGKMEPFATKALLIRSTERRSTCECSPLTGLAL